MEALLKVKNLSISVQAPVKTKKMNQLLSCVEDISFEINPGEILGLAGESGSGKSLTALSIMGLLGENKKVTNGSIVFSRDAAASNLLSLCEKDLEVIRGKEISMIFQEPFPSLNPLVKVGAQIAETLELHGEKNKSLVKNRVMELMARLKFENPEKLTESYPHQLSGGMCQRVMIALAIINRPRLLIADEPTTALDQNTQGEILSLLKEINEALGTSILYISHDLSTVKNFCTRVLVMYCGRILEEGNTGEIFSNPKHEYTKNLLASIPNRANRGKELAVIPGRIPSLEEGRPQGCPFHPRCLKAGPLCRSEFPPAKSISANHKTHCVTGGSE